MSLLLLLSIFYAVHISSILAEDLNDTHLWNTSVVDSYIVVLDSDSYDKQRFRSPQAELYHQLGARGVSWTTTREYHDSILTGAVIKLDHSADLTQLTEVVDQKRISPVYSHSITWSSADNSSTVQKRAPDRDAPRSHIITGIDRLHTAGYFGQGVTIGVVDTGVDYTHPALGGALGPGNKIVGGYDFVGDAYTGEPGSPPPQPSDNPIDRCNGHGTFVAGIIGADPGHRRGVIGVAPQARMNAYRVSGCRGGPRDDIVVDALLRAHRDGNDIITLSAGFHTGWGMSVVAEVMNEIAATGRVIVTGVGNEGRYGSWLVCESGNHQGIISVGSADYVAGNTRGSINAVTSPSSSYGPSCNMLLKPSISAPGENLLSTWPMPSNSYRYMSGTSVAAPFVAGSIALWLEAKRRISYSTHNARAAFQNTALFLKKDPHLDRVVETAAHQGAGFIQAHRAIFGRASMLPAELLLNDTVYAKLSWTVFIKNSGPNSVAYTLAHVPAGTAITVRGIEKNGGPVPLIPNPATVYIRPSTITVRSGSTRSLVIRFRPPVGLDAMTFPVYSGYITATGSDGSTLQSTYLGVAATLKQMTILDNTDRYLGIQLPCMSRNGQPVTQLTTYTMRGADRPVLIYRLVSATALLRLDLIDARAHVGTNQRRWLGSHSKSSTQARHLVLGKRSIWDWVLRRRRRERTGHTSIVGTIYQERYIQRNVLAAPGSHPRAMEKLAFRHFVDGTPIPDGSYKLLLRVLKINGNAKRAQDYETWTSLEFSIRWS